MRQLEMFLFQQKSFIKDTKFAKIQYVGYRRLKIKKFFESNYHLKKRTYLGSN